MCYLVFYILQLCKQLCRYHFKGLHFFDFLTKRSSQFKSWESISKAMLEFTNRQNEQQTFMATSMVQFPRLIKATRKGLYMPQRFLIHYHLRRKATFRILNSLGNHLSFKLICLLHNTVIQSNVNDLTCVGKFW